LYKLRDYEGSDGDFAAAKRRIMLPSPVPVEKERLLGDGNRNYALRRGKNVCVNCWDEEKKNVNVWRRQSYYAGIDYMNMIYLCEYRFRVLFSV
jgi:hypothetical protein